MARESRERGEGISRWEREQKKKTGGKDNGRSRASSWCVRCEARECYLEGWVDGFIKN